VQSAQAGVEQQRFIVFSEHWNLLTDMRPEQLSYGR
jgi:hypothetical protein